MRVKFVLKQLMAVSMLAVIFGMFVACSDSQTNAPLKESGVVLTIDALQYDTSSKALTVKVVATYTLDGNATIKDLTANIAGCELTGPDITSGEENNLTLVSDINQSHPLTYTGLLTVSDDCNSTEVVISAIETTSDDTNWPISVTGKITVIDSGAGSPTGSEITAISDVPEIFVTTNNEAKTIEVRVKGVNGSFVKTGTISVGYPDAYFNNEDTGYFKENEVEVKDTKAIFTYIGPNDVYSITQGTKIKFKFFDKLNPALFKEVTIDVSFDSNVQPPALTGYTVDFVGSNSKATVDLETTTIFTMTVKDKNGKAISDAELVSVKTTSEQPNLMKFIKNDGTRDINFPYPGKNSFAMTLETYRIAGLVPVKFELKIRDANGNTIDKNVTKSITVFSGPPTAMSISYWKTLDDTDNAKFTDIMVVSLTDKWNNPVNTNPTVYAGAIVGYKTDATSTIGNKYMIRPSAVATIDVNGDAAKMDVTAGTLTDIVAYEDVLMTFGNHYTYQASGKWDIESVAGSTVFMKDKYTFSAPTADMGYAVGNNHRQDPCEFGREWIGQVDSADGKYVIDTTGNALINFRYDFMLTGKTVVFGASVLGIKKTATGQEDIRIGEAIRHTLRGHGYEGSISCSVAAGATADCGLTIHMKDTGYAARNVNFSYDITGGQDLTINSITTSMGAVPSDLYVCPVADNAFRSFVTINVTNSTTASKSIGVSIRENRISDEF